MLLDKLFNIFNNLEEAYKTMGKSLSSSSRKDFILKMFLDDKGNSVIPFMKDSLSKEFNSYNEEQKGKYSSLIVMLDSMYQLIMSGKINEIAEDVDLNNLLIYTVNERYSSLNPNKLSSEDLISKFILDKNESLSEYELFSKYGEIDSFCKKNTKGQCVRCYMKHSVKYNFLTVNSSLISYIRQALNNNDADKDFIKKAVMFISTQQLIADKGHVICSRDFYQEGKLLGRSVKYLDDNTLEYRGALIHLV